MVISIARVQIQLMSNTTPPNWPGSLSADITHRSTMALPISSTIPYYDTQDNQYDNTSGIQTSTKEITIIFKIQFGLKKDMNN